MEIKKIKICNFRGYKNQTTIEFGKITAFIGKNDIGKSSILEALDIFFNDGKEIKIDENDANIDEKLSGNQEIAISVCFTNLPPSIIIDELAQTTLQNEYLLNLSGELEIIKKFNNGSSTPKVFIKANHPTNPKCADLLLKKNVELKKIVKDNSIACDDFTNNSLIRQSIWKHYSTDLQLSEVEINVAKEDAKKIWEKLKTYLPVYSLFQSDRSNSDGDAEVQDPLKKAVKQILQEQNIQAKLNEVATTVREKLEEVTDRTMTKLREFDNSIANSLSPVIPPTDSLKWTDVFKNVSISGDNSIPINKRGSGTKRLILLSFFRGEAERLAESEENQGIIYAIEEPETSQHTNSQINLIKAFKSIASHNNVQVIITTHSPFIVKQMDYSALRLIANSEAGEKTISNVNPSMLQYPSLNEVNYLAFGETTEEYHDELYGYLDENNFLDQYKRGKDTVSYIKVHKDRSISTHNITMTEYIRHQIHHPENTHNRRFTKDELKTSIEEMRNFIANNINN